MGNVEGKVTGRPVQLPIVPPPNSCTVTISLTNQSLPKKINPFPDPFNSIDQSLGDAVRIGGLHFLMQWKAPADGNCPCCALADKAF